MAELKKGRKVKSTLKMFPQGTLQVILQYFTSSAAASEPRTAMASLGVFRVNLSTVTEYVYNIVLFVYIVWREILEGEVCGQFVYDHHFTTWLVLPKNSQVFVEECLNLSLFSCCNMKRYKLFHIAVWNSRLKFQNHVC